MPQDIPFHLDGDPLSARPGETIAAALIRLGRVPFRRHPIDQSPRAPFCMMGTCHECLVEVNGRPAQQACLRQVEPEMRIRRHLNG